jgi:hypothetical protein
MSNALKFYINGAWVDPVKPATLDVINPATEEAYTKISVGSAADVDRAVAAARAAFPSFSQTSKEERLRLLRRILEIYKERIDDIARACPTKWAHPWASRGIPRPPPDRRIWPPPSMRSRTSSSSSSATAPVSCARASAWWV